MRSTAIKNVLRSPITHFLVLGLILASLGGNEREVVLDEDRVAALTQQWARDYGRPPHRSELRAFLRESVDEEILLREAVRRNLDKLPVVRRRLLQLGDFLGLGGPDDAPDTIISNATAMGLLESDPLTRRYLAESMRQRLRNTGVEPPLELEMKEFLHEHREEFLKPRRVRLSHVFVGGHEPDKEQAAHALFERLQNGVIPPEQALALGDPFIGGQDLPLKTEQQLAAMMGVEFGQKVIRLREREWARPIHSPYGWHIPWVHEVVEGRVPELASVRGQVLQRVLAEREREQLALGMEKLRQRYRVQIDSPAMQGDDVATRQGA